MSRYEAQIAGQAQRDAEAAETNALAAARQVRAYQRAVIRAQRRRARGTANAADAFIAGVPRWPNKGVLQALRQSLPARTRRGSQRRPTATTRRASRRCARLCVRAEILSATATPPEDAGLRRDQEMQLLRQGLGQARQADDRDWEAMRLEWLGIGAVAPEVHDGLEHRFVRCLGRRR